MTDLKVHNRDVAQRAANDQALQQTQAGAAARAGQKYSAGPGTAGAVAEDGDEARISALSRSLSALVAASPEREQRIAELQEAVGSGAYAVDPQAVAASLVEDAFHQGPAKE